MVETPVCQRGRKRANSLAQRPSFPIRGIGQIDVSIKYVKAMKWGVVRVWRALGKQGTRAVELGGLSTQTVTGKMLDSCDKRKSRCLGEH